MADQNKPVDPEATKAQWDATYNAKLKALTEKISAMDGKPGLSGKDIALAFHLFDGMSEKQQLQYLKDGKDYWDRIHACLHDPNGITGRLFLEGGVIEELAKEAMLPPNERTADHQLTDVDAPCKASLGAEKALLQAVDEHGPAAATPAVPKTPQTRGK